MDLKKENQILLEENQHLKETLKVYQNHLEKVIERHSVEYYKSVVQKNREADGTASQNSDENTYCGKPVANY
ncbi:hypothetical protein [Enterococcus faecium]|uniref:hypothetical protein n=1 Tax=Enterococcus faecium TaxID=1352 RepID=UPI001912A6CF|nr:hypothetical protein [Enterococcus faecium]MBK5028052.1 hypothetical protein [Enterococcus faecium]MBK5039536.1 hypothetical protein [Enterococcus faecium]MBK5044440.1 hypothetical protein [Enterococcus faecium]MBK5069404.1 hypothetical protein [Enterococcus faecium]MBK5132139.1 hypothetical protein [Enterococcus faecium]